MSKNSNPYNTFFLIGALLVPIFCVGTLAAWVVGGHGSVVSAAIGAAVLLVSLVVLMLLIPNLASGEIRGPGNLPVDVEAKRAAANRAGQAPGPRAVGEASAPTPADANSGRIHRAGDAPVPSDTSTRPAAGTAPAAADISATSDTSAAAPTTTDGMGAAKVEETAIEAEEKSPAAKPVEAPEDVPAPRAAEEEVAPVATTAPAPEPQDDDGDAPAADKPATLDSARGGQADDLKRIKGVGPKLEQLLNSMGFYHFDQIANWTDREVAWVDDNLEGFKGRVTRDQWVSQARTFAAEDNAG